MFHYSPKVMKRSWKGQSKKQRLSKKELIHFATAWMELESIMLSEINQAVKDKYHTISPLTGT